MKAHFEQEAVLLNARVGRLAAAAENALQLAVRAIRERNPELAREVFADNDAINQEEVRIEEECLKILALHQPVAGDLRYIITLLKVNNELDRIGDLAQNIAERAIDLAEHPVPAAGIELGPMMTEVRIMLKQALDALSCRDTGRAAEVIARDDTVDRLHRENFRLIKQGLIRQPEAADYYLNMLTASRHLERVADCATNIGEDVIYLEQGRIVRHAHLS